MTEPLRLEVANATPTILADAPAGAPRKRLRVQAFPISDAPLSHPSAGELRFDRAFAERVLQNFRAYPGEIPADYDHGTEKAGGNPETGIAAGWVRDLRIEEGGVFAYVDPTARALSLVEAGEYRFASPTVHFDWTNPQSGKAVGPTLLSLALTNRPFIRGMLPVEIATFSDLRASRAVEDVPMPEIQTIALADHEAALVALKDEIKSLSDRATTAEAALAKLRDEQTAREIEADVTAAEAAGKITPANRARFVELRTLNAALFADIVATLPVAAPMAPAGVDAPATPPETSYEDKGAALVQAAEKIATEAGCSFRDALIRARAAHPELADGF